HFTIGLRVNVIQGTLPQVQDFPQSYTGAQQRTLPTKSQLLPMPTVDASVGLFKGIPLGLTNVGGVDLLLSASYIPSYGDENDDVSVKVPNVSLKLGWGARVGLLQESLLMPGVSVSFLHRDLPTLNVVGQSGSDEL